MTTHDLPELHHLLDVGLFRAAAELEDACRKTEQMAGLVAQQATWRTYCGDVVKVYATAEPDGDGGTKVRWHWKRTHNDGQRVLARGAEPKERRKDALWEARRVNPPPPSPSRP